MKRRFQIGFLRSQGLEPRHRLLDIGCGTLRGGIAFIDYLEAGHYVGVDSRPKVLEEARQELAESGLEPKEPELVCSSGPPAMSGFDYAWAFSTLIHMPDEIVQAYLQAGLLGAEGALYANVLLGESPQLEWSGFPVIWRPLELYEEWAGKAGLHTESLGPLHELGHRSGAEEGDSSVMLRFSPRR
jgi:SAM-dependent methyltransferase